MRREQRHFSRGKPGGEMLGVERHRWRGGAGEIIIAPVRCGQGGKETDWRERERKKKKKSKEKKKKKRFVSN